MTLIGGQGIGIGSGQAVVENPAVTLIGASTVTVADDTSARNVDFATFAFTAAQVGEDDTIILYVQGIGIAAKNCDFEVDITNITTPVNGTGSVMMNTSGPHTGTVKIQQDPSDTSKAVVTVNQMGSGAGADFIEALETGETPFFTGAFSIQVSFWFGGGGGIETKQNVSCYLLRSA